MLEPIQKAGYPVGVAHGNFQLRAMKLTKMNALWWTRAKRPIFRSSSKSLIHVNTPTKTSYQFKLSAENCGYAWFQELMGKEQFNFLATAHREWFTGNCFAEMGSRFFTGKALPAFRCEIRKLFALCCLQHVTSCRSLLRRKGIMAEWLKQWLWRLSTKFYSPPRYSAPERNQSCAWIDFFTRLEKITGELEFLRTQLEQWKAEHVHQKSRTGFFIDKGCIVKCTFSDSLVVACGSWYGFNIDQCHDMMQAMQSQSGKICGTSHLLTLWSRPYHLFHRTMRHREGGNNPEKKTKVLFGARGR